MTINQIKKQSFLLFIEKGYEGTSLADIAQEVGIKKQSIYSHFKNKDDLFLTIVKEAIDKEIEFLRKFFEQPNYNLEDCLKNFISQIKHRYIENEENSIKFVLRLSFMPPPHLKEEVLEKFDLYYFQIEDLVTKTFLSSSRFAAKSEKGALSFMTLLDGLFVALLYGTQERFNKKFEASWDIYWNGLSN